MSTKGQDTIADYLIGTFYRFEHVNAVLLGEREDRQLWPESRDLAFVRIGEVGPKCVLVTVARNDKGEQRGYVLVKFEWVNTSGPTPLRGQETHALDCNIPDEQIELLKDGCAQILTRSLEIFSDVLEGKGVAGPISALKPQDEMDEFEDNIEDDESEAPDENQVW